MNTALISFRIARYLKYIIVARNHKGHNIHSPFIFDLVTRVFRNKTDPAIVYSIEKIRKSLVKDKRVIDVTELGANSDSQKGRLKKVSDIARCSAVSEKYGKLLANMAAEFGKQLVIEFGTSFGISTMYMAASVRETPVLSMEGCPFTAEIAENNFMETRLNNIRLYVGPFEEKIPEIINQGIKPGLIFIDGNHRKGPVLDYFEKMAEIADNNTVIILDDINYSPEMEEAWNEIRQNEKVTLSIDIYRMGIVFFRKGIGHYDYTIRY